MSNPFYTWNGSWKSIADDIPDSVVNRWPFDEGSGQTAADAESTDDLSFNFENWVSDSGWIGGFAKNPDGVDDTGTSSAVAPGGDLTMAASIELPQDEGSFGFFHSYRGGSDADSAGGRGFFFEDTNVLNWRVANDSGSTFRATHSLSTNTKYRVVGVLDTTNSEIRLYVNGSLQDTVALSGSFSTAGDAEHMVFAEPTDSGARRFFGGICDEPLTADDTWSDSEISDDYQRMPFA